MWHRLRPLPVIASAISVVGSVAIIFQSVWAFVPWTVSDALFLYDNYQQGYYEQIPIWVAFGVTNIIAIMAWTGML